MRRKKMKAKIATLEMKRGTLQQIPMKFTRPLEYTQKDILQQTQNICEMGNFLDTYDLAKHNQEDVNIQAAM